MDATSPVRSSTVGSPSAVAALRMSLPLGLVARFSPNTRTSSVPMPVVGSTLASAARDGTDSDRSATVGGSVP